MSKSNAFENAFLLLVFNNTNIALVGDATGLRGSSTAGSLFLSLHTADPGEAGSQTSNETTYGSYARVGVTRSSSGFTVSGNTVTLTANVDFPTCASGTATITHFGIGTSSSGAGTLLWKGPISPNIPVSTGTIPRLLAATNVVED